MRILTMIALAVLVGLGGAITATDAEARKIRTHEEQPAKTRGDRQHPPCPCSASVLGGLGNRRRGKADQRKNFRGPRRAGRCLRVVVGSIEPHRAHVRGRHQGWQCRLYFSSITASCIRTRGIFPAGPHGRKRRGNPGTVWAPEDYGSEKRHGCQAVLPESRISRELPGAGH